MKAFAIILNIFIPGSGSLVIGRTAEGIGQILIWGLGFILTFITLGIGLVIGGPMMLGAWIWGLVTVLGTGAAPNVSVTINDGRNGPPAV